MYEAATLARLRRWVAVVVIVASPGCAIAEKISKVSNPPGSDAARLNERLKKRSDPVWEGTSSSVLLATPPIVEFGHVQVASDNQRQVEIFNPHKFAVTVIHVTVQGCGFDLLASGDERHVVAAEGKLILGITFRPLERRTCSGVLLVEIDSAGGRLTRVALIGTGI